MTKWQMHRLFYNGVKYFVNNFTILTVCHYMDNICHLIFNSGSYGLLNVGSNYHELKYTSKLPQIILETIKLIFFPYKTYRHNFYNRAKPF